MGAVGILEDGIVVGIPDTDVAGIQDMEVDVDGTLVIDREDIAVDGHLARFEWLK